MKSLLIDRYGGHRIATIGFLISVVFGCFAIAVKSSQDSVPHALYQLFALVVWIGLVFGLLIVFAGVLLAFVLPLLKRKDRSLK